MILDWPKPQMGTRKAFWESSETRRNPKTRKGLAWIWQLCSKLRQNLLELQLLAKLWWHLTDGRPKKDELRQLNKILQLGFIVEWPRKARVFITENKNYDWPAKWNAINHMHTQLWLSLNALVNQRIDWSNLQRERSR